MGLDAQFAKYFEQPDPVHRAGRTCDADNQTLRTAATDDASPHSGAALQQKPRHSSKPIYLLSLSAGYWGQNPYLITVDEKSLQSFPLPYVAAVEKDAHPHAPVVAEDARSQRRSGGDAIMQSLKHGAALAFRSGRPLWSNQANGQFQEDPRHGRHYSATGSRGPMRARRPPSPPCSAARRSPRREGSGRKQHTGARHRTGRT